MVSKLSDSLIGLKRNNDNVPLIVKSICGLTLDQFEDQNYNATNKSYYKSVNSKI